MHGEAVLGGATHAEGGGQIGSCRDLAGLVGEHKALVASGDHPAGDGCDLDETACTDLHADLAEASRPRNY